MKAKLSKLKKRKECFGSIQLGKDNPKIAELMTRKGMNIKVSFENVLSLKLALEAAALYLNQYHLGQRKSQKIGVNLFLGPQGQMTVTLR